MQPFFLCDDGSFWHALNQDCALYKQHDTEFTGVLC